MNLLKRLFGNDNKRTSTTSNRDSQKNRQNKFLTNSAQFGFGDIELGISGKIRVDGILAIAEFERIAKERMLDFEYEVMYVTLLEEGALTVPIVLRIGEKKYSLYFIYQEEDLLKYKDLVKQIERTAYPNLIYFSSIPIYEGYTPKPIIEPFQLADLRYDKNAKLAGTFAIWWSTEMDPTFSSSETCAHLMKLNEVFNGYESYLTGYVLRQVKIVQEHQLKRVSLPEENVNYIINAPENKKVILNLSQEKGIRFLFPVNSVSPEYRNRFLKGILADFFSSRLMFQNANFPKDEASDVNSSDWFKSLITIVKEKEMAGETVEYIGAMEINSKLN